MPDISRKPNPTRVRMPIIGAENADDPNMLRMMVRAMQATLVDLQAQIDALSKRRTVVAEEREDEEPRLPSTAIEDFGSGCQNYLILADTVGDLPSATAVDERTIARITTGDDEGELYKINAAESAWEPLIPEQFQIYVAGSKATLPSVGAPAIGYAGGRYYVRSGTSWLCISHLEADE